MTVSEFSNRPMDLPRIYHEPEIGARKMESVSGACVGATEKAGMENAGLENGGPNCRGGKGRTGKHGTKMQGRGGV